MSMYASLAQYGVPGSGAVPLGANVPSFGSMAGGAVAGIPALNGVDTAPRFALGSMGQANGGPTPQFGFAPTGMPDSSGIGFNLPTGQLALSGLAALGNLWGAYSAQKLARDQLDFTKSAFNTNLKNSLSSYNTALEDRARSRGATEGQSQAEVDAYVAKNRLSA